MSAHFTTPTDELLLLAETLGEVKTKADKLEAEFATQARPLEAATNALSAALSGIKALQFHVLDNNLGALSARVEEMRKAVDEQVGVIALELKKADDTNAAKAGQEAEALRSEIAALQAQLGTLGAQFSAQLERVEFSAKEEAKKLQLIPGPAGAAGASLNPRGTFIDGETYNRLDVVSWLGSSYIAAVDGVTEKPSRNSNQWQVLASRGGGAAGGAADFGSLAGVAQINQGGTGQTTRAAGLNALLPSQTGNVQYMLLTDGAGTVSWGAQPVAGLPSQTSNGGKLLTTDGTNASWSGAVTVSGSNATVTGTLTVNGAGGSIGGQWKITNATIPDVWLQNTSGATSAYRNILIRQNSDDTFKFLSTSDAGVLSKDNILTGSNANGAIGIGVTPAAGASSLTVAGVIKTNDTTASTTTSSGALVVSGGVGVAGAIYVGGYASTASHARIGASGSVVALSAANNVDSGLPAAWNGNYGLGVYYSAASTNTILIGDGSAGSTIFATRTGSANTSRVTIDNANGNLSIASTTNASSTSFAALVVSGGVGVAKRIVSGEGLTTNGDNETQITFTRNGTISIGPTSASTPKLAVGGGLQLSNTSQSISAWGDIGPQLSIAGAVVTDTSSSGTVSRAVANSINATAFAASSSTTYTQAVSLFIADAPTANANVTITHRYALYTAGGRINFQGLPTSSAGLQAGTLWNDGGTLKVA